MALLRNQLFVIAPISAYLKSEESMRKIYLRVLLPISLLVMLFAFNLSNSIASFYEVKNVTAVMDLIHNFRKEHEMLTQCGWRFKSKPAPPLGGV